MVVTTRCSQRVATEATSCKFAIFKIYLRKDKSRKKKKLHKILNKTMMMLKAEKREENMKRGVSSEQR